MGEAKRRREADRAPVGIVPGDDPTMAEALQAARTLMTASMALNARSDERRLSSTLSTACQTLVLQDRDQFALNDLLNGFGSALAWALHPAPPENWKAILASLNEHVLAMAADSAAAAALAATPHEAAGHA